MKYLAAYCSFGIRKAAGFALPIFSQENAERYIQDIDEYSHKISGFTRINSVLSVNPITAPLERKVGQEPIYIFINEKSEEKIGTLSDISNELRRFYSISPPQVFLNLQIAELIGTDNMRETARAAVYRAVAKSTGYSAANAFLRATIRQTLWNSIITNAVNVDAAEKLSQKRREIFSDSDPNHRNILSEKIWNEIGPLIQVSKDSIIEETSNTKSIQDSDPLGGVIKIYTMLDRIGFDMPEGSTPLDVAYRVHTELGNETVGVKVNGMVVPLRTRLKDGDRVQILRSKAQSPQCNWKEIVGTNHAYREISRQLRRLERKELEKHSTTLSD